MTTRRNECTIDIIHLEFSGRPSGAPIFRLWSNYVHPNSKRSRLWSDYGRTRWTMRNSMVALVPRWWLIGQPINVIVTITIEWLSECDWLTWNLTKVRMICCSGAGSNHSRDHFLHPKVDLEILISSDSKFFIVNNRLDIPVKWHRQKKRGHGLVGT